MTSDPNTRASNPADWSASDALVLEGLSGLDELMVNNPDCISSHSSTSTIGHGIDKNFDFSPESTLLPVTSGFRTARELRAAQERFNAQRRSAARRRENTQGIGFEQQIQDRVMTDSEHVSRSFAKPSPPVPGITKPISSPSAPPRHKPQPPASTALHQPASSSGRPSRRRTIRMILPELERSEFTDDLQGSAKIPPAGKREYASDFQDDAPKSDASIGKRARSAGAERAPRMIDPEKAIRPHTSSSKMSWATAVLLSVLATSLLWSALLFAFWTSFGSDWSQTQLDHWFQPAKSKINTEIAQLEKTVHKLEEDHVLLEARVQNAARLQTLERAFFTSNSRELYNELLTLGTSMETPSEVDLYQGVKQRVEQAYINKVSEHRLAVKTLFPKARASRDTELYAETLRSYLAKRDEPAWDRARAAYLLREFKNDEEVIRDLRQTIRDDANLPVIFAAWDALIAVTGHQPAQGFDILHFDEWWRNRSN